MTKTDDKSKETPEQTVARIKAEQEEKQAAAKKAASEPDPSKVESTEDPALKKQAEDNLAKALEAVTDDDPDIGDIFAGAPKEKIDAAKNAAEKLRTIAMSYQRSSPDSHVVFGFGGQRFTLGELRALFNL